MALALIIERVSSLRTARVAPPKLLDEVVSVTRAHLPGADVVNKLAENSILGMVLATGLRTVIADPRLTEPVLRASFESAGRVAVHRMERYMNTLGTIASAAPLLGLLGTVIGMIITFQVITEVGAGDPKLMAGGISQAMIATVLGLMIAIPLLFVNSFLMARSRTLTQILDEQAAGLLAQRLEQLGAGAPRA